MKKIFLFIAIGVFPGLSITNSLSAQSTNNLNVQVREADLPVALATHVTKNTFQRALNDLKRNFKVVNNIRWENVEDGHIATFTSNGIKNTVAYNTKGNWQHTIRQYREKNLPNEVRTLVKSNYFNFNLSQVEELTISGATIYLIHADGINEHKLIRISEEKMEVIVNTTASNL